MRILLWIAWFLLVVLFNIIAIPLLLVDKVAILIYELICSIEDKIKE